MHQCTQSFHSAQAHGMGRGPQCPFESASLPLTRGLRPMPGLNSRFACMNARNPSIPPRRTAHAFAQKKSRREIYISADSLCYSCLNLGWNLRLGMNQRHRHLCLVMIGFQSKPIPAWAGLGSNRSQYPLCHAEQTLK